MPGIVEFPQLVQRAVEGFGDLFYGEPQGESPDLTFDGNTTLTLAMLKSSPTPWISETVFHALG